MSATVERIVHIMACMYGMQAEAVVSIWEEYNEVECYLFLGHDRNQLVISCDEIDCLIENEIIEFDSGSDEDGHEIRAYRLTDMAQVRIQAIIKNKKKLRLEH